MRHFQESSAAQELLKYPDSFHFSTLSIWAWPFVASRWQLWFEVHVLTQ